MLTSVSSSLSLMRSDVRKQLVKVAQTSQNTPVLPLRWFCSGSLGESTISPHKHNWNSSPRPASSHAEENKFHTRFCPTASPCYKLAGISPFKWNLDQVSAGKTQKVVNFIGEKHQCDDLKNNNIKGVNIKPHVKAPPNNPNKSYCCSCNLCFLNVFVTTRTSTRWGKTGNPK